MTKFKRFIASALVAFGFAFPALLPATVSAADNIQQGLNCGANLQFSTEEECESPEDGQAGTRIDNLVTTIINIISLVVGIVAVFMIIIGGLRYITSNGDSGNVTNAKNTILYAIVGLVIVALAQLVVRFVVERLSQAPDGS
jgi:cytochrome bd-type quinol oxidase subunit 2